MIAMYSLINYYYPKKKDRVDQVLRNNTELVTGAVLTAILVIAFEIPLRIFNSFIWSIAIEGDDGVFVTVWLPLMFTYGLVIIPNVYYHIKFTIKHSNMDATQDQGDNDKTINTKKCVCLRCYDGVIKRFTSNITLHVILVTGLFLFLMLYAIFPAFLLLFAYPVQVIATLALVTAFLFAMVIFSAIMIKLYKRVVPKPRIKQRQKTLKFIFLRFFPFLMGMLFLQLVALVLLYSLVISRGSVINSEPLFFLSMLPSAAVSGVTWMAKRTLLDEKKRPLNTTDSDSHTIEQPAAQPQQLTSVTAT